MAARRNQDTRSMGAARNRNQFEQKSLDRKLASMSAHFRRRSSKLLTEIGELEERISFMPAVGGKVIVCPEGLSEAEKAEYRRLRRGSFTPSMTLAEFDVRITDYRQDMQTYRRASTPHVHTEDTYLVEAGIVDLEEHDFCAPLTKHKHTMKEALKRAVSQETEMTPRAYRPRSRFNSVGSLRPKSGTTLETSAPSEPPSEIFSRPESATTMGTPRKAQTEETEVTSRGNAAAHQLRSRLNSEGSLRPKSDTSSRDVFSSNSRTPLETLSGNELATTMGSLKRAITGETEVTSRAGAATHEPRSRMNSESSPTPKSGTSLETPAPCSPRTHSESSSLQGSANMKETPISDNAEETDMTSRRHTTHYSPRSKMNSDGSLPPKSGTSMQTPKHSMANSKTHKSVTVPNRAGNIDFEGMSYRNKNTFYRSVPHSEGDTGRALTSGVMAYRGRESTNIRSSMLLSSNLSCRKQQKTKKEIVICPDYLVARRKSAGNGRADFPS